MKGGKEGRKRKTSSMSGGRSARAHGKKANPGVTKRLASGPPKKGSRKKTFGGTSTAGEE
jgi:hypothetical protein